MPFNAAVFKAVVLLQVLELFKAADKYDVSGLLKECVQIFKKITRSMDVAPLLQVKLAILLAEAAKE